MDEPRPDVFPPSGVDLDRPSVARIYDYYLDGHANWAIDREFGDRALETFPLLRPIARANRQFLFRVVRHLMGLGVRQFVDLGAGVPTMGHTHEVADSFEPDTARVVYVDNEPVAVAHAQILLEQRGDQRRHSAINADIRAPERLWHQVLDTGLIDLTEPVALLMIAVLHVQQRDETGRDMGADVVAQYRHLLPSGSYLAISHATDEGVPADVATKLAEVKQMYDTYSSPVILRTHQQIANLFGDFDLLPPGLTWTTSWHSQEAPDPEPSMSFRDPSESIIRAAIGRKP
jgi:hypothetical protein